jgi:hypothetical protein
LYVAEKERERERGEMGREGGGREGEGELAPALLAYPGLSGTGMPRGSG